MQIMTEVMGVQDCLIKFVVNKAEPEFGIPEHVDEFEIKEVNGKPISSAYRRVLFSHICAMHGEYDRIIKLCEESAGLYS